MDEVGLAQGPICEGRDPADNVVVRIDPRYFRPTEVASLLGDPSKAREKLGWAPRISFEEMIAEMVREDLKEAAKERDIIKLGHRVCNYYE